ncbi:cell division cycle protein 20 homolog B [Sarcophilus harrisii]|uniref:cell division cycle protein 20 homolog B n=1 Tax=Sarcophilus harrisii TaxID=9305 RepID=UPI001301E018|nr:cell division cycle protein 20 homolog B [Sarcophilus harrisii]
MAPLLQHLQGQGRQQSHRPGPQGFLLMVSWAGQLTLMQPELNLGSFLQCPLQVVPPSHFGSWGGETQTDCPEQPPNVLLLYFFSHQAGTLQLSSVQALNPIDTPYSNFKNNIMKRQTTEMPIASSPITTRGQQVSTGNCAAHLFGEDHSLDDETDDFGSELERTQEEVTMILADPLMDPLRASSIQKALNAYYEQSMVLEAQDLLLLSTLSPSPFPELTLPASAPLFYPHEESSQNQSGVRDVLLADSFFAGCRDGSPGEASGPPRPGDRKRLLPRPQRKMHLTGLRDDYYLNILDWNSEGLLALALGSAVHIWNGESHDGMGSIDLSPYCNYISSISWIKEGGYLAIGTSEGEVQLWDVMTKKRLRNMVGHISVVGALSWNHCVLSSGSRLGRIHHYDVRVAQHHIGTLGHKRAICALKWSPSGKLLSSGCTDGLLNIWPYDPGVGKSCQPLKVLHHSTSVKAMNWCPWQSEILAVGGGMKDGHLHVWDINRENSIQSPCTKSQICSLIWLPKTKEIATGHGTPRNEVTLWSCPVLTQSGRFFDHRGRVLHLALSPDQSKIFSVAADGTACMWKCC